MLRSSEEGGKAAMDANLHRTSVTDRAASNSPKCNVLVAREACREALSALAAATADDFCGQPVRSFQPDYWVGVLQGVTTYLLVALEEADAQVHSCQTTSSI